MEYDARGNVIRETNPLGRVVDRTFDARNNRLSETEPYDPASPPSPYARPLVGRTTPRTTSSASRIRRSPRRDHLQLAPADRSPRGRRGRLDREHLRRGREPDPERARSRCPRWPRALRRANTYDAQGNLKTQTAVVGGVSQVTRFDYDARGQSGDRDRRRGSCHQLHPRRGGEPSDRPPPGRARLHTRPAPRRPWSRPTSTTGRPADQDHRSGRDLHRDGLRRAGPGEGHLRQATQEDDLEYDLMGRRTRTTYPDSTTEEATYDGEGRRLTAKDRAGRVTAYDLRRPGKPADDHQPRHLRTENHYDPAGRLDWTRDARGKTTFFEYDAAGRRTRVRRPALPRPLRRDVRYLRRQRQPDLRHRPRGPDHRLHLRQPQPPSPRHFPGPGGTASRACSPRPPTTSSGAASRSVTPRGGDPVPYDKVGRLTKVIDAEGKETSYSYDELGNRVRKTDANGHVTRFEYDGLGRQTRRVLPGRRDGGDGLRRGRQPGGADATSPAGSRPMRTMT